MRTGGILVRTLLIAIVLAALTQPAAVRAQGINELLKKQQQIQKQLEQSAKALEAKKNEASSIQGQIANLSEDLTATQARIRDTEEQISLTNDIVSRLTSQIDQQNQKLRKAYSALYELSRTSGGVSSLFGGSLNDTLSQAQYIQAIQSQLQVELVQLGEAKSLQEQQKASLEQLSNGLESDRQYLASQRNRQSYLLSLNSQQQADYDQSIKNLKQQQIQVNGEIAAYYARFSQGAQYGGTGGYPWAGASPWVKSFSCVGNGSTAQNSSGCSYEPGHGIDSWNFFTRNCTSYAAWRWLSAGKPNFLANWPGSRHAKYWPTIAEARGMTVSSTPQVGDIVSWPGLGAAAAYGHVAIVEAVSGGSIAISQYNAGLGGLYSTATKSSGHDPNLGTPRYIRP